MILNQQGVNKLISPEVRSKMNAKLLKILKKRWPELVKKIIDIQIIFDSHPQQ